MASAVRARPALGAADAAAALSLVAASGHLLVMRSHFEEWWAYGLFFAVAGVGQCAFALVVTLWPRVWLLVVGVAGNVAIVVLYVLSRANGVPLGPHAGRPEDATAVDIVCLLAELGVIATVLWMLPQRVARRVASGLMLVGVALWAARLTGLLL